MKSNTLPASSVQVPRREGSDLVIRIPAALADRIGLEAGEPCSLTVQHGRVIVTPASQAWAQLEQLVSAEAHA